MIGERKAALARMKRAAARAQAKQAAVLPLSAAVEEARETPAQRNMIARWVAWRIVDWPSSQCFGCKKPIVYGAKWTELVNHDNGARARFHSDCEPVWRAEQEVAARRSLWGTLNGAQK
jgi:hypothetical protein